MRLTILALALLAPAAAFAQVPPPQPAAGCTGVEHRQFDFWVGRWTVYPTGADAAVADSLIERVYSGCGVRENWMPYNKADGGSLNIYLPGERAWAQTWIDSYGARADFRGGWSGKAMVLTGDWPARDGRRRQVRMTYTPAADGSVRQQGEASFDGGASWTPTFDFTYRKAGAGPPIGA